MDLNPVENVIAKAKELLALRDKKEALEKELKEVNKAKERLEVEVLPRLMSDHEIEKMSIEGVGTLYTQGSVYAYIFADQRDVANQWMKDNGHGDLVKETIHHQTLKSWAKEQLENGHDVPDLFNIKPITTARIRRKS